MAGPIGSPDSASLDCANPFGSAAVKYRYKVTTTGRQR